LAKTSDKGLLSHVYDAVHSWKELG